MALLPLEVIQVMSPDLAAHAMVEQFIALAKIRTANVRAGGFNEEKWALAVALRAMHMMTLQLTRPLGEAGSIAMKIEGKLHLSFSDKALQISASNGSTIDLDLSQTQYGRQLVGLIKGTFVPYSVAGTFAVPSDWEE